MTINMGNLLGKNLWSRQSSWK